MALARRLPNLQFIVNHILQLEFELCETVLLVAVSYDRLKQIGSLDW